MCLRYVHVLFFLGGGIVIVDYGLLIIDVLGLMQSREELKVRAAELNKKLKE